MRQLAILLAGLLAGSATASAQGRLQLETEVFEGEVLLTLRAEQVPVARLLSATAEELGLELRGTGGLETELEVDAFLVRRPLRSALNDVLMGAGLRARVTGDALEVEDDLPAFATSHDAFMRSYLAHESLLRETPDHLAAVTFELRLAEACVALGPAHHAQAIVSYDRIAQQHAESPEAPDALLRSASLLSSQGRWNEAALRYRELADLGPDRGKGRFTTDALLGFARCMSSLAATSNDPGYRSECAAKALLALDTVELNAPTSDRGARYERAVERARALSLSAEPLKAMKAIDLAATVSPRGPEDPALLALRAEAFTAAQRYGDASTAWMMHARSLEDGEARVASWQRAADAALAGDFEVAVLMIHGVAEDAGFGDALLEQRNAAELRLQLGGERITALTARQSIDRGSRLLEQGLTDEAVVTLRRAWSARETLGDADRVRLAVQYARALDADGLESEAIGVLRAAAGSFDRTTDRQVLYRAAADLHERRGRTTAAIAALRGEL